MDDATRSARSSGAAAQAETNTHASARSGGKQAEPAQAADSQTARATKVTVAQSTEHIGSYKVHPAAAAFPMLDGEELKALVEDIKTHGLKNPIVLHKGEVLDGRNRLAACLKAGVRPTFADYHGESPTEFVVSQNLMRRHLTPSQRAMLAAKMLPFFEAEAQARKDAAAHGKEATTEKGKARDKAAAVAKVNPRYVQDAKKIAQHSKELARQIESGKATIQQAKKQVAAAQPPKLTTPSAPAKPKDEFSRFKATAKEAYDAIVKLGKFSIPKAHKDAAESTLTVLRDELKKLHLNLV